MKGGADDRLLEPRRPGHRVARSPRHAHTTPRSRGRPRPRHVPSRVRVACNIAFTSRLQRSVSMTARLVCGYFFNWIYDLRPARLGRGIRWDRSLCGSDQCSRSCWIVNRLLKFSPISRSPVVPAPAKGALGEQKPKRATVAAGAHYLRSLPRTRRNWKHVK